MNVTGASNATYWRNCSPCFRCGGDQLVTTEFHGWWMTYCVHCGEEHRVA
jgi:hypothetical protein